MLQGKPTEQQPEDSPDFEFPLVNECDKGPNIAMVDDTEVSDDQTTRNGR